MSVRDIRKDSEREHCLASLGHFLVVGSLELSEARLELLCQGVTDTRDTFERRLEYFIGVQVPRCCVRLLGELDPDIADGFRRVGHRIRAELDVLVLDDLVAQQVAESVVIAHEGVSRILHVVGRVATNLKLLLILLLVGLIVRLSSHFNVVFHLGSCFDFSQKFINIILS